MALVVADRVKETTNSTGTGTLSLAGAVAGFQSFAAGVGTANTTYYAITDSASGAWEVGIGTVTVVPPASALDLTFNTRTYVETLTTSTATTNTVPLSAGTEGDVAILWDQRINIVSDTVPSAVTPSGWTLIGPTEYDSGNEFLNAFYYKVLTASDVSSGTVTTGNAENVLTTILFFTPSSTISSVASYSFTAESFVASPVGHTQDPTTSGSLLPALVFGVKTSHAGLTTPNATLNGTWDGTFLEEIPAAELGHSFSHAHRINYISTSSSQAISSVDDGNAQVLVGFHISVSGASLNALSRDTVLESSNSDNLVNFGAGQKIVICTQPAEKAVYLDGSDQLVIDGVSVTATAAELNYVDGVTSNIQTQLDAKVAKSGDTMTGFLTLHADPTNILHAATKQYVDTIASASLHYHDPVRVESPTALTATYNNGTSGVGATLTNSGTQAALVIDGVTLDVADRVLIYTQADATQNGVYTVTDVGSASTNWVLTRATDADSSAPSDPDALGQGDAFFVQEGTTGAGELYVMNTEGTITFGTTEITFVQISSAQIYSAGDGLDLNGVVFSHTDTSSQASVNNSNGTVIQDITLDTFGHITAIGSADLDGRYYTETEIDSTVSGLNSAISLKQDAATALTTSTTFGGDVSGTYNAIVVANDSHTHDTSYYTETEIGSFFAGTTAITGYNKTNWDTAYGWGNHASAGYLTGNQTITLSGDVSGSGTTSISVTVADDSHNHIISNVDGLQTALDAKQNASTALTTSTSFSGDVSGTYNAIVVADDSHNHIWDNIDGASVNAWSSLRVSNANGYIDFGPANTSWAHIYTDRPAFYFNAELYTNNNRVFHDGYHPNADKWTTARTITLSGDVTGSASFDGSANFTVTTTVGDDSHAHSFNNLLNKTSGTGTYTTSGDFRAPIFYDSNDTNYYVNPAATSRIRKTNLIASGTGWDDGLNLYSSDATNRWNILVDDGAADAFRIAYNNSEALQINTSRNVTAIVDVRSPIFYDSNNTAYYGDFANANIAGVFAGSVGINTSSPVNTAWGTDSDTKQLSLVGSSYAVINLQADTLAASHYSMGVGGDRFYIAYDNDSSKHRMVFFNDNLGINGVTSPSYNLDLSGTGYASSDFRAPIFYDSNNTGYYGDFASTSLFNDVRVNSIQTGTTSDLLSMGQLGIYRSASPYISFHSGTTARSAYFQYIVTEDRFYFGEIAYTESEGSFRAPLFYDSDNTAYYADPASTSRLNVTYTNESYTDGWFRNYASGKGLYNQATTQHFYSDDDNYWNIAGGTEANGLRFRDEYAGTVRGYLYADNSNNIGLLDNSGSWKLRVVGGDYTISEGSSIRAPIFYDSNNTGYYTDPASTSVMNSIYLEGSIYHNGDTNTYMQFHAADQWRVVTGGTERLEVNSTNTTVQNNLIVNGNTTLGNAGTDTITVNGAITFNGTVSGIETGGFPAGTAMLFAQTAAPTGWTKSTTHNDKALRVVSGTASSGGTTAFSTALATPSLSGSTGSTTLTTTQIPSHSHSALNGGSEVYIPYEGATSSGFHLNPGTSSGSAGGGGSHNHTMSGTASINVQYVDVIIATKD